MKSHPELLEAEAASCDFERYSSAHNKQSCRVTQNEVTLSFPTRNLDMLWSLPSINPSWGWEVQSLPSGACLSSVATVKGHLASSQ